jgi:hypothetical protein
VVKAKNDNTKAVKAAVGSPNRSRDNSGQQPEEATSGMAALHLPDADADKLLERRRIRIGWNLIHGLLRIRQTLIPKGRAGDRKKLKPICLLNCLGNLLAELEQRDW